LQDVAVDVMGEVQAVGAVVDDLSPEAVIGGVVDDIVRPHQALVGASSGDGGFDKLRSFAVLVEDDVISEGTEGVDEDKSLVSHKSLASHGILPAESLEGVAGMGGGE
jgi:hypothetical protein